MQTTKILLVIVALNNVYDVVYTLVTCTRHKTESWCAQFTKMSTAERVRVYYFFICCVLVSGWVYCALPYDHYQDSSMNLVCMLHLVHPLVYFGMCTSVSLPALFKRAEKLSQEEAQTLIILAHTYTRSMKVNFDYSKDTEVDDMLKFIEFSLVSPTCTYSNTEYAVFVEGLVLSDHSLAFLHNKYVIQNGSIASIAKSTSDVVKDKKNLKAQKIYTGIFLAMCRVVLRSLVIYFPVLAVISGAYILFVCLLFLGLILLFEGKLDLFF